MFEWWKRIGGGMLVSMAALRMYILPLAGFLIQLEELPPSWRQVEQRLMVALFPGARGWATPTLLQSLKDLGFPAEMPDFAAAALGAKCRVHRWEDAACGGLLVRRRLQRLTSMADGSQFPARIVIWRDWINGNFFANLHRAQRQLADAADTAHLSVDLLLQGSSAEPVPKRSWQKKCCQVLRCGDAFGLHQHLRRRLERWRIPLLPGHRVHRLQTVLRRLGPMVPPCAWAATLKTMLDGWTCTDPSRRSPHCCFGCKAAQDSIQHYAFCPCVAKLARSRLRLEAAAPAARLEDFLLLHRQTSTQQLALRALRLYATFIATNAARNGRVAVTSDAWVQAMTEAAARDAPLRRIVANLWSM